MFLKKLKLKAPAWPMDPSLRPRYPPPTAWQASSSTSRPRLRAIFMIAFMLQDRPHMCTGITARVCGVILLSRTCGDRVRDSSTSATTGIAPALMTPRAVAM